MYILATQGRFIGIFSLSNITFSAKEFCFEMDHLFLDRWENNLLKIGNNKTSDHKVNIPEQFKHIQKAEALIFVNLNVTT